MNNEDRELLEYAAKAAGMTGEWHETFGGSICLVRKNSMSGWNPLTDDGDAFRLMVKLGMEVEYTSCAAGAYVPFEPAYGLVPITGNLTADLRRAIVETAAMKGRGLESLNESN